MATLSESAEVSGVRALLLASEFRCFHLFELNAGYQSVQRLTRYGQLTKRDQSSWMAHTAVLRPEWLCFQSLGVEALA